MKNEQTVYLSLRSAAAEMGLKGLAYTRRLLGTPDVVEKQMGHCRALYSVEHVRKAKEELELHRVQRINDRGKRGCYHCRRKFDPVELKSGICSDCQAWRTVLNFSCHGDCTKCPVDCKRLKCLKNAITKMERRLELFYR